MAIVVSYATCSGTADSDGGSNSVAVFEITGEIIRTVEIVRPLFLSFKSNKHFCR